MFDYRELKRHDKLNYELPDNSDIQFIPESFWNRSRLTSLIIFLGIVIILLLIIILVRNKNLRKINKELNIKFDENLIYNEQLRKFSSALDQSDNIIIITDLNAHIEYANKKFETVTGYAIEDVLGKNPRFLRAENADRNIIKELWQKLGEGKTWSGEFKNVKKDGTIFWEYATISPIRNISGDITSYIAIKEDITEKKQKEERLSQLNRLLELKVKCNLALLLSGNEEQLCEEHCNIFLETGAYELAVIQYLDNGKLINTKPEYSASKFDVELDMLMHKCLNCGLCEIASVIEDNSTRYYHAEDEIPNKDCVLNLYNLKSVISLPIIHNEKTFGILTLYTRIPNRFDEEEIQAIYDIIYILSYGINTFREQKRKEEIEIELAQEKEELSITLSSLSEGVATISNDGFITLSNKAAIEIFGGNSSLLGKNIFEVLKFENIETELEFKEKIQDVINGKAPSFMLKHINLSATNGIKILSINGTTISKSGSSHQGLVLIFRDITELTRAETQSALSQKLESIGSLASGIAHEINTPLQFVNDNTSFLNDSFKNIIDMVNKISSKEEVQELKNELFEQYDYEFLSEEIPLAISQSQEGLTRVSQIVKAMKDFAHTNNTQKKLCDLNQGIEVTTIISRNEWKYIADLELNLGENLPKVYCSPEEINQVILNMIVNSAHAIEEKMGSDSDEKGKIQISTYTDETNFIIEIKDNGIGIEKDKISKIFDPFFTTKEVGKGTGQGLAITHEIIINKHSGELLVDSTYGQGTTIKIIIPIGHHEES
ncbi:MAG: PAS domain S-box protein [Melioribacteraceae bacterium]|nr:PAS domain S-box protein [Melioribacteraceae bacterium]